MSKRRISSKTPSRGKSIHNAIRSKVLRVKSRRLRLKKSVLKENGRKKQSATTNSEKRKLTRFWEWKRLTWRRIKRLISLKRRRRERKYSTKDVVRKSKYSGRRSKVLIPKKLMPPKWESRSFRLILKRSNNGLERVWTKWLKLLISNTKWELINKVSKRSKKKLSRKWTTKQVSMCWKRSFMERNIWLKDSPSTNKTKKKSLMLIKNWKSSSLKFNNIKTMWTRCPRNRITSIPRCLK